MKKCCKCEILKSLDEFHKNKDSPDGKHTRCKLCSSIRRKRRYQLNRNEELSKNEEWHKINSERVRAYNLEWQQRNLHKYARRAAKRRADKLLRTPIWLSEEHLCKMKEIYKNRPEGYHVDHIIPLNGKEVCGLHVPWNLQYLPALENLKKNNKL